MKITVDTSFLIAVKDMREEQTRFFALSKQAKAMGKANPKLWSERKACLDASRQMESLVDARLNGYLNNSPKPDP
ncbi:hypothetical protein GCM10027284_09120 [Cyclobacterium sediminis]